jgi:hypothetical protein
MPDKSMFFISTIFRLEKGVLGRSCQESKRAAYEVRYQDSQNRIALDDEESKLSVELAKEKDAKMKSKSGKRVL